MDIFHGEDYFSLDLIRRNIYGNAFSLFITFNSAADDLFSKLLSTENQYDDQNRIKSATYILPNNAKQRYSYSYSSDNLITGVSLPASSGLLYSYDDLNRRTLRRIAGQNVTTQVETYSYYSPGQYAATNLVNKITYADNSTLSYTYNSNNNIIAVTDGNGKRITYKYDGMGQLIRENNPYTNLTTVYSYDKGGNITSVKEYAYTTAAELGTVKKTYTYTYGDIHWKDKLTSYNGEAITYDEIGNPLTYRDSLSFTWKNGRQLASLQNGSSVINYTYNADGVRIGKSGSRAGTFIVSGTQILREINSVATIDYLYDESGSPIGLTYKGTTYYYRKNLQGDIIAIVNSSGTEVVNYSYNAWGRLVSMTGNMELGANNPFRYRGYYYDTESGLYYLNSRYYDPQTGRFINAEPNVDYGKFDDGAGLNGYNVFAYCANNPVMFKDDSREFVVSISIGIGSLITWAAYGIATAVGVGAGVAIGTAVGNNIRRSTTYVDTRSDSKAKEKDRRIKKPAPIYIYRYNGTNPGNLTPRAKDKNTGLSFSTIPPINNKTAAVTTIEEVNSTGNLIAVQDGPSHVSIKPRNGTMFDWIKAGTNSIWTKTLKRIVKRYPR